MEDQLEIVKNLCISLMRGMSNDAKERKAAEEYISNLENNNGYACLLLSMISGEVGKEFVDERVMLPLILTFKNFFMKNYKLNEAENLLVIPENDVASVRQNIINISLMLPKNLSCHLDTTIGIIAKKDFPRNWPNFLQKIVSVMTSVDVDTFTRFLNIIHGAFKKYRYEFKSNELWSEIQYAIGLFGPVLINLFNHAQNNLPVLNVSSTEFMSNKQSPQNIQFLSVLIDCYHDLISQEVPDLLVDHLDLCMKLFFNILSSETLSVAMNSTKDEALQNDIIKLQKRIITVLILFVKSYEEDIKNYLPGFIEIIYKLALITPKTEDYDKLNIAIIKLFLSIAIRPLSKGMLSDINTINNIFANVIITNAPLRETEVATFQDEPNDYILKDIEWGDLETKRKSVSDLIRTLIATYGDTAISIINRHIELMMSASFVFDQASRVVNIGDWLSVDLTIYLIISAAIVKESPTIGPITLCTAFDITTIFERFIAPLLLYVDPIKYPVLKADALKFIHVFRNFINPRLIEQILPNVLELLNVPHSKVISSYVFIVSGDLLTKTTLNNQPITKEAMENRCKILINNFSIYYKHFVPTQQDNIYQLKWLIKWFNFFNINVSFEFLKLIAERLIFLVDNSDKLHVSPEFIHLLFEVICLMLWLFRCINKISFEDIEIRLLESIIKQIVRKNSLVIGYACQVYSLFMKLFRQGSLSDVYVRHYSLFLTQDFWLCKSNVPGLCQIMNSYLVELSSLFSDEASIRTVIDLFKYCLTLNHMDGMSVSLAKNIVINLPDNLLKPFLPEIMSLCFKRLALRRTYRFTQDLLSFIFQFVALYGVVEFKTILDSLDSSLFSRFIQRVLLLELSKPIHRPLFKKLLITLSLLILEQSLDFLIASDYALWWALFKSTVECMIHNKTLFTIDTKLDDNQQLTDNDIETIDHIAEDESFNRLHYAFILKLPFSGDVCLANKRTVSSSTLQQYDLKPTIQKILNNPEVHSHITNHITMDTIQQIQTQLLSQS